MVSDRGFRDALGSFATGVTVITTRDGERIHGMTANGFMSVSLDPALVVVSVARSATMHELLHETGRYAVSVLAAGQERVSRHFAGRPQDEIALEEIEGAALVEGALAHVVADVVDAHQAGDHTLFVGEVRHFTHRSGEPLVFHSGVYRCLIDPDAGGEWTGELNAWRLA
jgi:flavin reductase (DIM6/NTAB) family NADH-FMN oxidoreductase RutF